MTGNPKKYEKAFINISLVVILIWGCIFVAPKVILLFMPFVIGGFLALLASPMVKFLEEKLKIKRKTGSALVIVLVIGGICFLIYAIGNRLVKEVVGLFRMMPQMWNDMEVEFVALFRRWSDVIDSMPDEMVEQVRQLGEAIGTEMSVMIGELSIPTVDAVGRIAGNIPAMVVALSMCLLSAYFFVAGESYVPDFLKKTMSSAKREKCLMLKKATIDVIVGYIKAQFKIEIWVYLVLAAGFMLLRVRYGYLIAIPIAMLDILPVLGTGTVLVPWALFRFLCGNYMYALGLLVIWGVGQLVRQVIQPKMIGDSMGMAPIPTLVHLYVGYKLAGFIGMIVAVPLGILIFAMNDAGFFDNSKKSIQVLWRGLQECRQFEEEDFEENSKKELCSEKENV